MKILQCPVNGPRPVQEFVYGGEYRPMPDPDRASDAEWGDYVYHRKGSPGVVVEWWCHVASNTWFLAERDTAKDLILKTFLYEHLGKVEDVS